MYWPGLAWLLVPSIAGGCWLSIAGCWPWMLAINRRVLAINRMNGRWVMAWLLVPLVFAIFQWVVVFVQTLISLPHQSISDFAPP